MSALSSATPLQAPQIAPPGRRTVRQVLARACRTKP